MSDGGVICVKWGEPYGCDLETPSYSTPDGPVWMFRRGQRCRYFGADGEQVGPEQANVAPAICYAAYEGWIDPFNVALSIATNLEVRSKMQRR